MGPLQNMMAILALWLMSVGVGTWLTFFKQPGEIEDLRLTEQNARIKQSEVAALLSEESMMQGKAAAIQAQWDSRYKTIPKQLATHEVVAYLNSLTQSGFQSFDLRYDQMEGGRDFNTHKFKISGKASYRALYDFVWAIENYRSFYKLMDFDLTHIDLVTTDKTTGNDRMDVYVQFEFDLHAYFGGKAGLSADDQLPGAVTGVTPQTELPPVPASILPSRKPAKDPFYPLIMSQIPPNTYGLLNLDVAVLESIVDGKAVFRTSVKQPDGTSSTELVDVGVGDDVYLGRIIMVDPIQNTVVARLNMGGIMDERVFTLDVDANFRQALGPAQLAPSN
ncbi:MAG: hypothetical protein JJ896_08010 [Rhodothermales bacterium]|nr:hypothetical protein [Rhodothermales bacterium]MBO6779585.1 hypothetical protein [Rhodothermales bacterium]